MIRESDDILYVVMPAYNEEKNITQVITSWIKVLKHGSQKSRLVVADSGSSDNTHKILLNLQKKFKQLEILNTDNQYHGPKLIALYKYAISRKANFIFQTDSDGQTDPDEFIKFWQDRNKYDGILGYRKIRGDGKARAFVEKVVCFLLRIFFGVKVKDANAPFRLMRRKLLKKYIDRLPKNYELPNIMLTTYFVHFKEKITFKKIKFAPRTAGKNSINLKRILGIGLRALPDFWRFRKEMKKDVDTCSRRESWKSKIIAMALFAMISGTMVIVSPAFPWNGGMEMTDSSVFLTIGRQMKNGVMPYVDTFDHKGPLLYVINFLGVTINETKGIFIFEFLAIFATLWYMFKTFRLKNKNIWFSGAMTLALFTPFINIYFSESGNLTEQYAMPFIAFSLYVFLKYFLEGKVSSAKTFWTGVSLACVAMMRINMVGVWLVFGVGILIKCLASKEFSELWRYIKWFFIGVIFVVAPITIWLITSGAFSAFVDVYIKFNMAYSADSQTGSIFNTILFFIKDVIIFLSVCLTVFMAVTDKKHRFTMCTYAATYGICIIAACMSGRIYPHYGMVLVPLTVFPFAVFCHGLCRGENCESMSIFMLAFLMSLTFNSWIEVANRSAESLQKKIKNSETIEMVCKICDTIGEYTEPSDKISVYGNWNYVYLRCNRLPASKYSYQFPISEINPNTMDEYLNDIKEKKPKAVVIQDIYNNDNIKDFLKTNDYAEEWRGEDSEASLYILNGIKDRS